MSTLLKEESETRIVLENVSWEIFVALADECGRDVAEAP